MKDAAFYFPDGGTSELWGAAVTACGVTRAAPGAPYPPNPGQHPGDHLFWLPRGGRILDCYQLLYIAAGRGTFASAAMGAVEIGRGSAFLVFPEVWHRYAPDAETGWTEYFLELRGPAMDRLRAAGVLRPQSAVFVPGVEPELVEAFETLRRLAGEQGMGVREQMATLGMHLLARIVFARAPGEPSAEERAVRAAQSRMLERLGEGFEMTELAREFGIGYDRFRRCFKALTGLAPKQYYRQLQMRSAETLLLHSRRTLAEIAEELGFNSAFHLSAAFKEHAGMAPLRWRERGGEGRPLVTGP
ncbi:MAG: AraC family transcriptional regulator [Chthoniobacteraceae bacterium]|nr:AraC family transcriptional regulator [Chthoniobacteraceae bacterium]